MFIYMISPSISLSIFLINPEHLSQDGTLVPKPHHWGHPIYGLDFLTIGVKAEGPDTQK